MRVRALLRRACARMLRTRAAAGAAAAVGLIVLFLLFADAKRLIAKGEEARAHKEIPTLKSAEGKNVEVSEKNRSKRIGKGREEEQNA